MKTNAIIPSLAIFIAVACVHCAPKPSSTIIKDASPTSSRFVEDILDNVNEYRHSRGMKLLVMNNIISAEAEEHSKDMASGRVAFGHDGFDARIKRISSQLGVAHQSAENVASGILSPKEVVSNWINSPGHRQNIEGDYTLTGIGIARNSKGVTYFTQIFIRN